MAHESISTNAASGARVIRVSPTCTNRMAPRKFRMLACEAEKANVKSAAQTRRRHARPRVTNSSSSCSKVSQNPLVLCDAIASSRASFVG